MTKDSPFWTIFGKVSAVITMVAALISIWVVVTQPNEDLELRVEFFPYAVSPDLNSAVKNNFDQFSYSALTTFLEKRLTKEPYLSQYELIDLIQSIHKGSWGDIDSYNYRKYGGLNYLILSNTGNKTATDIQISLPVKGIVQIIYPDERRETVEFTRTIKLNDLRATGEISMVAWSESELSEYNYDELAVTHKNGVGEVIWPVRVTGFVRHIENYKYFTALILWLIFTVGMAVGSSSYRKTDGSATPKNESNDRETDNA